MLTSYMFVVAAPIFGMAAYVLGQIVFNWLTGGRKLLLGFFSGIVFGGLIELVVTIRALQFSDSTWLDAAALTVVNQFTFLALAFCYVNFLNMHISALRIRLLHELSTKEQGLTEQEILQQYNAREIVSTRLRRLTSTKHLHQEGDRYYSRTTSMLMLAKVCRAFKRLLFGDQRLRGPWRR